jgi:hypothetical protein
MIGSDGDEVCTAAVDDVDGWRRKERERNSYSKTVN